MVTRKLVVVAMTTILAGLFAASAKADPIVWQAPQKISGDSDVSTSGHLVYAENFGDQTVTAQTINGVTFAAFDASDMNNPSGTATHGNVTVSGIDPNFNGAGSLYRLRRRALHHPLFALPAIAHSERLRQGAGGSWRPGEPRADHERLNERGFIPVRSLEQRLARAKEVAPAREAKSSPMGPTRVARCITTMCRPPKAGWARISSGPSGLRVLPRH